MCKVHTAAPSTEWVETRKKPSLLAPREKTTQTPGTAFLNPGRAQSLRFIIYKMFPEAGLYIRTCR